MLKKIQESNEIANDAKGCQELLDQIGDLSERVQELKRSLMDIKAIGEDMEHV
jgi:hypothetical protein